MPAGAKPGERRGGRTKGAINKRTREIAEQAVALGITPLEYMLGVLRAEVPPELKERIEKDNIDEKLINDLTGWQKMRFEAAKASAPYIHPRLESATVKIDPIEVKVIERVVVQSKSKRDS